MAGPSDRDRQVAKQSRLVAIVIVSTLVIWLVAQYAGAKLGWEARFVFLFDFAALAAFLWAFIVTFQIWRKRRNNEG